MKYVCRSSSWWYKGVSPQCYAFKNTFLPLEPFSLQYLPPSISPWSSGTEWAGHFAINPFTASCLVWVPQWTEGCSMFMSFEPVSIQRPLSFAHNDKYLHLICCSIDSSLYLIPRTVLGNREWWRVMQLICAAIKTKLLKGAQFIIGNVNKNNLWTH